MSDTNLVSAIEAFLADSPYYPCCLLLSTEIARLRAAHEVIEQRYHWPTLPINRELSEALVARAPETRSRMVKPILDGMLQRHGSGPILCTGIDLLFEPELALDPLALLRDLSRSTRLIVTWPGTISGGTLSYAVPQHAQYRTWATSDLSPTCLVPV